MSPRRFAGSARLWAVPVAALLVPALLVGAHAVRPVANPAVERAPYPPHHSRALEAPMACLPGSDASLA